jgi:cytochrome c oxidase assembly protein subunit 11
MGYPPRQTPAAERANKRVALVMAGVVVGMAGLAFASVPLYRLFCQVTGYGGTTQRAAAAPTEPGTRNVTVRFNASVASQDLGWDFQPLQNQIRTVTGEEHLVFYKVRNDSSVPTVGVATFNVTPHKAGPYFQKIACFCFSEQELKPGESMEMPVSFFVDPAIEKDPNLRDVTTITLSYTFFRAKDEKARLSQVMPPVQAGVN